MRINLLPVIVLACAAMSFAGGQTSSPPASSDAPGPPRPLLPPLSLTGCVQDVDGGANQFAFVESKTTHRLFGTAVKSYHFHTVRIVGGLYPTASLAAQAGDIDPSKAIVAAYSGGGIDRGHTKELRVERVQRRGSCPQP